MRFIRNAVPVITAVAVMACADVTGPGDPPPSLSLSLPVLETEFLPGIPVLDPFADVLSADGVVESARGGGHLTFVVERRTFAFTARKRSDGTIQGQFQINNRDVGPSFVREHGYVTCLQVEDNQAWVGGVVTHSDGGTEGFARIWRVIDNGEGANASEPDMITGAQSFGFPPADQMCNARGELPAMLRPIDDGNIQVTDDRAP